MELGPPPAFEPAAPQCAVHPNAQAHGTCARCGNFVCPLCLDPYGPLPEHCEACREREGAGAMAWERDDGSWLSRWWRTTRDVVFRPGETFARARPGRTGAAVGYAAVTGALIGCVGAVLMAMGLALMFAFGFPVFSADGMEESPAVVLGLMVGMTVGYPIASTLWFVLAVLLRAGIYHAAVALLGGRGGFSASLWTNSYLHGLYVAIVPLTVIQQVPIIGPIIGAFAYIALEAIMAVQLTRAAERYHGLEGSRATLAGWSLVLLGVVLGIACCLGMVFFVAMQR